VPAGSGCVRCRCHRISGRCGCSSHFILVDSSCPRVLTATFRHNDASTKECGTRISGVGWRQWVRHIAQRPATRDSRGTIFIRQPTDTGFTDENLGPGPRFWHGQGGAVMVGFRDPALGPDLPSVPEDDSHRTTPPAWLLEDTPESHSPLSVGGHQESDQ